MDFNSYIPFFSFKSFIILFYEKEWTQILMTKDIVEYPKYFRGDLTTSLLHQDSLESLSQSPWDPSSGTLIHFFVKSL